MAGRTIQAAAVQMKFRPTLPENLEVIRHFIFEASKARSDFILFPECAVTGYNVDFRAIPEKEIAKALQKIGGAARHARVSVLVGSPTFSRGRRFNSLVVFDRRGRETFRYHKIHLTARDAEFFEPGNALAFFRLDRVPCTSIICHERRYPELVRLPVMMGAQIVFHANAGLDSIEVSKAKRRGRDGIAVRAFENQIFYVFANSVGPQGNDLWSAGDSKIVAPDSCVLALANNRDEMMIHAEINLDQAGRKYAREALREPAFLRAHWKAMLAACRRRVSAQLR
jgi:predicted amidohydrolase